MYICVGIFVCVCVCVIKEFLKKATVWVSYYCFDEKSSFHPCIWTLASQVIHKQIALPFLWAAFALSSI